MSEDYGNQINFVRDLIAMNDDFQRDDNIVKVIQYGIPRGIRRWIRNQIILEFERLKKVNDSKLLTKWDYRNIWELITELAKRDDSFEAHKVDEHIRKTIGKVQRLKDEDYTR